MNIKQLFLLCISIVPLSHAMEQQEAWQIIKGLDHYTFCEARAFKTKVLKYLSHGVDINSSAEKWTPLSRAAFRGKIWQCRFFLELGADPNCANGRYTPLGAVLLRKSYWCGRNYKCCVRYRSRPRVFRFLLSHGADINQAGSTGLTPLMVLAAQEDDPFDILNVKYLLKLGADPLLRDLHGNTALDWARGNRNFQPPRAYYIILDFLRKRRDGLFTFLCCLKRLKQTGSQRERFYADAMYQNRNRIVNITEYLSLQNILNKSDCGDYIRI